MNIMALLLHLWQVLVPLTGLLLVVYLLLSLLEWSVAAVLRMANRYYDGKGKHPRY